MKGTYSQGNRQSLGIYKDDMNNYVSANRKDHCSVVNGHAICKIKDETKQVEEAHRSIPSEVNGEIHADIGVQS